MTFVQVLVRGWDGRTTCLNFDDGREVSIGDVRCAISDRLSIPYGHVVLRRASDFCPDEDVVEVGTTCLDLNGRLLGGKGGFGSLLRGSSAKVGQKATSNFTACRDLSGRRVRHVEDEKALAEWKNQQASSSSSSSTASVVEQYKDIKNDVRRREPCKYGDQCKYRFKNCKFGHERKVEAPVELVKEYATAAPAAVSIDLRDAIEAGFRKRKRSPAANDNAEPMSKSPKVESPPTNDSAPSDQHDVNGLSSEPEPQRHEEHPEPEPAPACGPRPATAESQCEEVDLSAYPDWQSMRAMGLDGLKTTLQRAGLKCGGTIDQRAQRLFQLKEAGNRNNLPKKLWATS
ncbi:Replication stress response SDE2 C-terminal [Plasmodiophora brassicae]|uniref:Uncharacterized protein n=1 Tax=Plasmodiophora brassicae TaxID=37360 RepID=A0A0G4IXV0_PLABS|nr:hypothetical protein PBRA_007703 [Plasmodiophora brassicae]SPQ99600.1 unnamed protein product [Plasmodiophora brassicae]